MQNRNTQIQIVVILIALAFAFGLLLNSKGAPGQAAGEILETAQTVTAGTSASSPTNPNPTDTNTMNIVTLETNKGVIVIETFATDAPKAVNNFVTLTKKGFYDNLTFHRVIKGFMIQGGDPAGNGTGGPGYTFEDELDPNTPSYKLGYQKGIVAMANAGPNTNGSQFFIMLENVPLPHNYTIFGRVVSGQEVVDAIGSVKTDGTDKPLIPVIIQKATVK